MRASRGGGGSRRRCRVATDEPGYPCIPRRWTGSDDARCVPWPRDAASPMAGRSYWGTTEISCDRAADRTPSGTRNRGTR